MNKVHKIELLAPIAIATAFILSCSSGDDVERLNGLSSSSEEIQGSVSSSSIDGEHQSYGYCLLTEHEICLEGPFALNDCNVVGGKPSNNCPYGSSQVEPSSSSVLLSSSSDAVSSSSSSIVPSSSSVAEPSSSSSVPSSSSSVVPSSSSIPPSSSSIASEPSSSSAVGKARFRDERDGTTYPYVTIGTQTWMASNLSYNATGSMCNRNSELYCAIYGRLYDWSTAKAVCPSGWHLPSKSEWEVMTAYIGGASTEGKKLKAKSGWNGNNNKSGNGTDDFGFSALPGGYGNSSGSFSYVGDYGHWWSASEYYYRDNTYWYAYSRHMGYDSDYAHWYDYDVYRLLSVRCLQD